MRLKRSKERVRIVVGGLSKRNEVRKELVESRVVGGPSGEEI